MPSLCSYAKELTNVSSPDVRRMNQTGQQQAPSSLAADEQTGSGVGNHSHDLGRILDENEARLSNETIKEHQLLTQLVGRAQIGEYPADTNFWLTLDLADPTGATAGSTADTDESKDSNGTSVIKDDNVKEVQAKRDGQREGLLDQVRQELLLDVSKLCEGSGGDNDLLSLMDSG